MTETGPIEPERVTGLIAKLLSPTCGLSYQLAQACLGRENHSALFELKAVPFGNRVILSWHDRFTGESGPIGCIPHYVARPVLRQLFKQLRAWRARCEQQPAKTMRASAGGRV